MRSHLHAFQLAGTPGELDGARLHFAGMDSSFLTGGAGFRQSATAAVAPPSANGVLVGSGDSQHIGVIGLVLLAVLILFVLDKAGFRFAVTAGKR